MDDIRDIKEPVPLGQGADWTAVAASLGFLALAGLAVWRWRRLAGGRGQALPEVLAGLRRLAVEERELDDRAYYYALAGLVREALEARLGIAATAMTTSEILPRLEALPPDMAAPVAGLLGRADPARYAGETVGAEARRADLDAAFRLAGGRPR